MIGYIYSIINKMDGQRYVGQTVDIERRRRTHFSKLRNNTHPNPLLQEVLRIGKNKFEEWELQSFSKTPIKQEINLKWWRN